MAVNLVQTFTPLQVMQDAPVIPVVVLHKLAHAVPLARALVAGGLRMLEITLRTPQALPCLQAIAQQVPQAVVGAGTVRTVADVQACAAAGARFLVSPGYTPAVGQACRAQGLPWLPGVATASEIMAAQEGGWTALKFFPAMHAGGLAMLQAWSGPFADLHFCPTGGLSAATAGDFLSLPNVVCVGGSWITPPDLIEQEDWGAITQLAAQAKKIKSNALSIS